jgi:phospholipid/cholesterol/gamma-HCH transport system permease protein
MLLVELRRVVSYATLTALTFRAALRRGEGTRVVRTQVARQVVFSGWDAIPLVALMSAVIACATVTVAANLLPSGQTPQLLSKILTFVLVRELAPWITAVIVILRSSSAITVELGYMSARGEIEAMQTLGVDPARYVLLPRFVGMIAGQVALTVVFVVAAFVAGLATAIALGVAPTFTLANVRTYLSASDVIVAVGKSLTAGTIVAAVACYHGLSVGRDVTQTPRRTTRALMEALVHCTLVMQLITLATL